MNLKDFDDSMKKTTLSIVRKVSVIELHHGYSFSHFKMDKLINFARTITDTEYSQNEPDYKKKTLEGTTRCCFAGHYGNMKNPLIGLTRNIMMYFSSLLSISSLESKYLFSTIRGVETAARELKLNPQKRYNVNDLIDRMVIIKSIHTYENTAKD